MQKRLKMLLVCLLSIVVVFCALSIVACKTDPCKDGHAYGNPSWQWNKTADGYDATATFVCGTNSEHTTQQTATVSSTSQGASCTESGNVTYTAKVTVNGREYTDVKTETVDQIGHNWNDGVWSWSKNGSGELTATIVFTCTNDNTHTLSQPATVQHTHTDVSCEEDGADVYTASAIVNDATYTDVKKENVQTKLGHDWDEGVWGWTKSATGEYEASYNRVCKNDPNHVTNLTANVTTVHTDSTCSTEGKDVYTAKVTVDSKDLTDTKTVSLGIVNHNFQVLSTTDSTCYSRGETVYKCATCAETYKESKALLAHKWDNDSVTCEHGQTCTNPGCGATKPALSHQYSSQITTQLDCEQDEITTYFCANCGDHYDVTTQYATGHEAKAKWTMDESGKVAVAGETCKYQITYHSVCGKCDQPISKVEEVEVHTLSVSIKQAAVCNAPGIKLYSCVNCSHTEEESYSDLDAHNWTAGIAQQSDENVVTYSCSHCGATKQVITYTESTSAQVSKDTLQSAGEIALKEANIALDNETLDALEGDVSISAKVLTEDELTNINVDKNVISGKVYNFNLVADNDKSGQFAGKVTVSIPYELSADEDPDSIAILYITSSGEIETYRAKYSNGYAVFETEHFSYYTVTRLTPAQRCELYGHVNKVIEYPATCVTQGYTLIMCGRCGLTERIAGNPATGHHIVEDNEHSRAATCTVAGLAAYYCDNDGCNLKKETVIPATGHDWVKTNSTPATCTSAGSETYVCDRDHTHTYTNTLAQKQHAYAAVVTAPTCTDRGYTTYTCANCEYSYVGDYRVATGHNYVETIVDPTCTKGGYVLHKCSACDDEYRSNETPARHVWNMEQPTCGEAKVCVICGTTGAPATGNHTVVNGICSVCGQGCDHAGATVTVIAPTCTENGYTLTSCAKCGLKVTSNYVAATGHVGNTSCSVCEEKLLNEQFFTNALNSILNLNYAVTLTDVVINPNSDYTTRITFGELNIGIDNDGKLFGYGAVSVTGAYGSWPIPSQIEGSAVIKDNYVYIAFSLQGRSSSYDTDGKRVQADSSAFDDSVTTEYVALELNQAFDSLIRIDGELLVNVIDWVKSDAVPLIKSIIDKNKIKINQFGFDVIDMFVNVRKTSGGYDLSINLNKLSELNDKLYDMQLGNAVDDVFGNGTYDKAVKFADKALNYTVSQVLDHVDLDDIIAVLDKLAQIVKKDNSVTFAELIGLDKGLKDFVNEHKTKTLFNLAEDLIGFNQNTEQPITAKDVIDNLKEYKTKKLYEEIAKSMDVDADEIKKRVDSVIDEIAGFNLNVVTSADGTITSVTLKGGCSLFEGVATISGSFQPSKDYDAFVQKVVDVCGDIKVTQDNFIHNFGSNVQYENYSDGSLKSIEYSGESVRVLDIYNVYDLLWQSRREDILKEFEEFVNSRPVHSIPFYVTETYRYMVEFYDGLSYVITPDCTDWAYVTIVCKHRPIELHYEISVDYKGEQWHIEFDGDVGRYSDALDTIYNYSTGKLSMLDLESHHVYEEDKSKAVIPADCTQFGKQYFTCKYCGDSFVRYYTVPHGDRRYEYEFDGDRDCTQGVTEIEYCVVCGQETMKRYSMNHFYRESSRDNFSVYGGCGDCGIALYTCACGKESRYQYFGLMYDKYQDEEGHYREGLVCENHCGIVVVPNSDTKYEGCMAMGTTTYAVYFEGQLACDTYKVSFERENHDVRRYAVLVEDAENCDDGWYYVEQCSRCGEVLWSGEHDIHYGHGDGYYCVSQMISFADKYDADNDGQLIVYGCACGENVYHIDLQGDCNREYDPEKEGKLYIFQDGFTVREYGTNSKDENCLVINTTIFELGVDVVSGNYTDKIEIARREGYNHNYYTSSATLEDGVESCLDGVWVTRKCSDCGYESEPNLRHYHEQYVYQTLDLAPYGAKCGEQLQIMRCACGYEHNYEFVSTTHLDFDIDDSGRYGQSSAYADGKTLYRVSCAVTDPKCDLEFYYVMYTVTDELPDTVVYKVLVTNVNITDDTFTAEETQYIIYRGVEHDFEYVDENNGCVTVEGRRCVNCGVWDWKNQYENHNYEVIDFVSDEKDPCYGQAQLKCSDCGHETTEWRNNHDFERIEEEHGCEIRVIDRCRKCGYERTYDWYTKHDYQSETVNSTCTKYGYEHRWCSKCDYDDYDRILPTSHAYQYNEEVGMYVCIVCGMKSINGADGQVMLEDLTSSDNPDTLIAGYWIQDYSYENRNEWDNDYIVTVTIINLDATGEDDDEILVDTVDFERGDQEVSFSKSVVDEFASENEIINYQIRLAFVHRYNGDLVYAITFE